VEAGANGLVDSKNPALYWTVRRCSASIFLTFDPRSWAPFSKLSAQVSVCCPGLCEIARRRRATARRRNSCCLARADDLAAQPLLAFGDRVQRAERALYKWRPYPLPSPAPECLLCSAEFRSGLILVEVTLEDAPCGLVGVGHRPLQIWSRTSNYAHRSANAFSQLRGENYFSARIIGEISGAPL
jgi:hypothetical protein